MRIIHVCSRKNYDVIAVIFIEIVSKSSGVVAPFQQKFKCHSSKMSYRHCNYPNAVFFVYSRKKDFFYSIKIHICLFISPMKFIYLFLPFPRRHTVRVPALQLIYYELEQIRLEALNPVIYFKYMGDQTTALYSSLDCTKL